MSLVYHCLLRYLEDQRNIVFQLSRLLSTFQFSEQRQYSNPRSPDLQPQPLDRESSLICKLFVVAHYCYYHMQYTHCITRPYQYEDLPNLNTTGNLICVTKTRTIAKSRDGFCFTVCGSGTARHRIYSIR